jgi:hypothetical protein
MEADVFAPNLGAHKLSGTLEGLLGYKRISDKRKRTVE